MSVVTDWITAVGTAGGAIGTVGAVIVALRLARRSDQREWRREERHQAERVTAWMEPIDNPTAEEQQNDLQVLCIRNASDLLIYDLIAEVVGVQGSFRKTAVGDNGDNNVRLGARVGTVRPGETRARISTDSGRGMYKRFAIEIAFIDAAGRRWLRRADGSLEQVDKHPIDLYDLPRPLGWMY
jgi:hypothetical protein